MHFARSLKVLGYPNLVLSRFSHSQQMLSQWLRLILRNQTILNQCYEPWSYTASTGFEDALRQLDQLAKLRFCLPTDVALRQLQSIHDAF